jgi:YVTN family beta-propeller protein
MLVACHIGGGYRISGTVTGLRGTGLVIENNSGDSLKIAANGGFEFAHGIDKGGTYSVTVSTQPDSPSQTCTVHNGSGTIDNADISNVIVSCSHPGVLAYVVNQGSNSISAYLILSNGALTPVPGSPFSCGGATPVAAQVDPDGTYLYVANNGSNTVTIFTIDQNNGALTQAGLPVATGNGPFALQVDPANQFLYVANKTDNTVGVYEIGSGTATAVSGSPYAVGVEPSSLAMDPGGNFLYVSNYLDGTVSAFSIQAGAGQLEPLGGSPFRADHGPVKIAIDPSGTHAYVSNEVSTALSGYSLNPSTGNLAPLSGFPLSTSSAPEGLAFDPGGRFLLVGNVTAANDISSYALAPSTGALTLASTVVSGPKSGQGLFPVDIQITPQGNFAYAVNRTSNTVTGFALDTTTGTMTPVPGSPFLTGSTPRAIAID